MKSTTLTCVAAITLFTVALPVPMAAQHTRYKLIDIGTLGGPTSVVGSFTQSVDNRGIVIGAADTAIPDPYDPNCSVVNPELEDCLVQHAFQWQKGVLADLGALPGVNSSVASWISANGLIAGSSENGDIDPLISLDAEQGPVSNVPETRAVLWKRGQIIDLGTLGGNESFASAVNSRGQVVGGAATAILDSTTGYLGPTGEFWEARAHAFLWQDGSMQDLGTLGGPNSGAVYINEAGQIAGVSELPPDSATGVPPTHPFLWENGIMRDLGTIGGTQVAHLTGLNERGQVIGQMTTADDATEHPFLWDGKELIDLGTFGGDLGGARALNNKGEVTGFAQIATRCPEGNPIGHAFLWRNSAKEDLGAIPGVTDRSIAWAINSKPQIVGISISCDFSVADAFLWENGGPMLDLNTLVPLDSALHLFQALSINERGEIAGLGVLPSGDVHAFLLIPCGRGTVGCGNQTESAEARRRVVLPENVRKMLRERLAKPYLRRGFGVWPVK